MSVFKRNYKKENEKNPNGIEVWSYSFCHRKVRYREAGFKNKREAVLAEEIAKKKVILEGRILKPFETRTFSEAGKEAIEIRKTECSPITIQCELRRLKVLNKYLGSKPVHTITVADINWFKSLRQKEGLINRAINLDLNLVRVIIRHAMLYHYATFNPMDEIKNLPEPKLDRPTISMDDFRRLVEEAAKLPNSEQLVVWAKTRAFCGCRPTECMHLEFRDIDWERNLIMIRPKFGPKAIEKNNVKNGEFRAIPIHPELRPALVEWKKTWEQSKKEHGFKHDYVFFYPADPTKRASGFRKSFERACRNAGIPGTNSYQFRHFFISEAVMAGCELIAIARWVGHGSAKMIERVYGHLSPEYQAKQMAKIGFGAKK